MVFGSSVVFLNRLLKKEALNEEKHEQQAGFKNSFTMISSMGKKNEQSDDFLECFVREKDKDLKLIAIDVFTNRSTIFCGF